MAPGMAPGPGSPARPLRSEDGAARQGAARPIRVLVVDDLAPLRRLLVRQLTDVGHAVVGQAATVAEAVALGAVVAPDVLLLDFELPDGRGTEVATRLAADACRVAGGRPPGVVFCTGDVEAVGAALAAHALAAHTLAAPGGAHWGAHWGAYWGACPVLEKPATSAALDAAVRAAAGPPPRNLAVPPQRSPPP